MVPLGTGGDFRRTLRIPLDTKEAIEVLQARNGATPRRGLRHVPDSTTAATAVRHFINIADAGLGGEVVASCQRRHASASAALTFTHRLGLAL